LGSTRKVEINLRETINKTKSTTPSPIKATPTNIASNPNDVCLMSLCNADYVILMSSTQSEEIYSYYSILLKKDPPEGKTTAIIAVMRGKPKDGYYYHSSNKHIMQKLVWVLLDSGSDDDLIFVNKDKPMLLPSLKRLVAQLWNTSNGMFQNKSKAG
jgi:hypothetical protein